MHRSGTSALARVLGLMGCASGGEDDFPPPDEANPRGYWERKDVWSLDEDLLAALGASWDAPVGVDLDRLPESAAAGFEARAARIVAALDRRRPWVVKDPRLCLLFPFWRRVAPTPVVLLVHRSPLSVARSLAARDGFPLVLGIALWECYARAALASSLGQPRLLVRYEDLIDRPRTTAARLLETLAAHGVSGLSEPPAGALEAFLDPRLERHGREPAVERALLTAEQQALAEAFADGSALAWASVPPLSLGAADLLARHGERNRRDAELARTSEELHAHLAESTENARSELAAREEAHRQAAEWATTLESEVQALREQAETTAGTWAIEHEARVIVERNALEALNAEREARLRVEETVRDLTELARSLQEKIAQDTAAFQDEHQERLHLEARLRDLAGS